MRAQFLLAMSCALALGVTRAAAHDSPEHEIEALTAKMSASGKSAELFARRAAEWRALGRLDQAAADLEEALALEPGAMALRVEMARVQAAQGRHEAALSALEKMLKLAADESQRCAIYMQRAEVLEARREYGLALEDCARAFGGTEPAPDWYLTRARLQARAGQWRESAAGLKEGFERTGSIVLEIEWIEAMIEAGQFAEALERIGPHLERARWKSGWLIRSARAQLGRKRTAEARESLKTALDELEQRIKSGKIEANLLEQRGLAQALLGNRAAAAADLQAAVKLWGNSVFSAETDRLRRVLGQ